MHNKQKHINLGSELPHFVTILQFNKTSILSPPPPPLKVWNFLGSGGFLRLKHLKKCMKPLWNFQRGGGRVFEKFPSMRGGMDNF